MGFYEGFDPAADGTIAPERLSSDSATPVPHNLRIGAGKNGLGGKSALYLFLDGNVQQLAPAQAATFLKKQ